MRVLRKWWKLTLSLAVLVIAAQICVSLLARTKRLHSYLTTQLERTFGRPVEVGHFAVQLLPPRFDANRITIGEDPAFGNEYFLRADNLSARLRWTGLLRGHFEFGTLSLSRPSLILVRNSLGRWNLEGWLPPAKPAAEAASDGRGPRPSAPPAQRLFKIEFEDGRVDFKTSEEKLAIALREVSGSVDQISPGRWQLQLKAQPWRSGVVLQSVGMLTMQGDVAGTSARLQPAKIALHWEQVSLADLFRLVRGRDYGIRGVLTLDGLLKSGTLTDAATAAAASGIWAFSAEARASQIHRWDLSESLDNPQVRISLSGQWNVPAHSIHAGSITVQAPRSNLRGDAEYVTSPEPSFEAHLDSAGIQATDLLAWYRAFNPGVDDGISAEQFFSGVATVRGWPVELKDAAFSSSGGTVKIPGIKSPVRIGTVHGGWYRGTFLIEPVRVALGGTARDVLAPKRRRIATLMENAADITLVHDLATHVGSVSVEGHVLKAEDALKIAAAFGRPLNHGWELNGDVLAVTHWDWQAPAPPRWNGRVVLTKARLAVAGLNQPLDVQAGTLNWKDGLRSVDITKVNGFGGAWTGTVTEHVRSAAAETNSDDEPKWNFNLTTDRMNASDLDRWVGPRARPSWLKRLLSSVLGSASPSPAASDLVRQVTAEGELNIGELTVEKLKLAQVHADALLRDLHLDIRDAEAQWGSGTIHAQIAAAFAPTPTYDVIARLDGIDLSQIPSSGRFVDRFAGLASGTVHLTTEGVGRGDLLENLSGNGNIQLLNVEFRGWDVDASVADGTPRTGTSRWTTGQGTFTMRNRGVVVENLTLESGREETSLRGTVTFARDADLTIQTSVAGKRAPRTLGISEAGHVLKISGPLDGPRVSVEKAVVRQPAG